LFTIGFISLTLNQYLIVLTSQPGRKISQLLLKFPQSGRRGVIGRSVGNSQFTGGVKEIDIGEHGRKCGNVGM
jgi:hypothetical protein